MLPQQGGVDGLERAAFERRLEVVGACGVEAGTPRLHVDGARRCEILGRLENGALLSVVERDGFHVVEREASQVHRAVLGVADLYAVEKDAYVLASHAADVDSLQSADSPVVLDLYAREVAECVGHAVAAQCFERFAFEFLGGDDFGGTAGRDHDLLDVVRHLCPGNCGPLMGVQAAGGPKCRQTGECQPAEEPQHVKALRLLAVAGARTREPWVWLRIPHAAPCYLAMNVSENR